MKNIKLGILGGGQLGRMSAMAAARLGIQTVIFTPEHDSPASFVSNQTIIGDYSDKTLLNEFAGTVDFISYEFENIPIETIKYASKSKPVYPDASLLAVAQDRIAEKTYLNDIGIPTARWSTAQSPDAIRNTMANWGTSECILKTTRFGYDGKGQARISRDTNIETAWSQFNGQALIMEEIVDFKNEISVIVARDAFGKAQIYGPMLNEHKNHILSRTIIPAGLDAALEKTATDITLKLAEDINLRGVLTLELFVTADNRILANEIAPRTHNSGHWSIDACAVSQFENHVRAVCGLPVGAPARHSDAEMLNLIGDDILKCSEYMEKPGACVHHYGKSEPRPGRKMGHVTFIKPKT